MGPQRMFGMTPWVRRLFVANLLVFLLQETVFLSAAATWGFNPLLTLTRPWTAVTYLFLHAGPLHLAFNMLMLYIFGPPVEERMGGGAFLAFYLVCGLGGALFSWGLIWFSPLATVIGASAAIYGVLLAFAWYWPDQPIYIFPLPQPIAAKWLVVLAVAFSLLLPIFGLEPGVAHLAHLGGFAAAFVWLKGEEWRLTRAEQRLRGSPERGVLVHPAARAAREGERVAAARAPTPDRTHAEVNRVLDKISASGMSSLTPAERRFLAEMSRKMRDRD